MNLPLRTQAALHYCSLMQVLGHGDVDKVHPDPFLRSMAHWMCKSYSKSLSTLLLRDAGERHRCYDDFNGAYLEQNWS